MLYCYYYADIVGIMYYLLFIVVIVRTQYYYYHLLFIIHSVVIYRLFHLDLLELILIHKKLFLNNNTIDNITMISEII